jgi:hypothetical protein
MKHERAEVLMKVKKLSNEFGFMARILTSVLAKGRKKK